MSIAHSKITAQGQISVPAEVRKRLGLARGSVLEWEERDNEIVVRRAGRYTSTDVHGALFPEPLPEDAHGKTHGKSNGDLKEGIRKYIRKRHARR